MEGSEEAKYWRDAGVLERAGGSGKINKATAVLGLGIDEENYDSLCGKVTQKEAEIVFKESYLNILNIIDYYMDMPEKYMKLIAIWILGTYLHPVFPTYPFLFINASKGSGKTRLEKIISHLAKGGEGRVLTEPTDSILFRTPKHKTLVFDEFEGIGGKEKSKFRLYLNASYKAGGVVQRSKKVKKKEEDTFEIETFEPYKPIVMANIWGMEEVLEDRCLTVILQKSNNPIKTKKIENFENNYTIQNTNLALLRVLCSLCSVVTSRNIINSWNNFINLHYTLTTLTTLHTHTTHTTQEKIAEISPENEKMFLKIDEADIDGRNLELIFPILITARILGEEVFEEILEICKEIIKAKKENDMAESKDVSLIDFIANGFDETLLNFISIKDLTNHFKKYLNELDDIEDKWLDTKWMRRALKRMDLITDKRRVARGNEVLLNISNAQKKLLIFRGKDE